MSESLFLWRSASKFLATHPSDEGWMVYEFGGQAAHKLYLHCVVDCLRDQHPDLVKRRAVVSFVEEDVVRRSLDQRKASNGVAANDSLGPWDSFGWRGEIEWLWSGHEIHCCMMTLLSSGGGGDVHRVATKSLAAFQDFLLVLDRYGQSRYKGKKKEILAVNGDNISVAAASWDDVVLPTGMAKAIRSNVQAFFGSAARYAHLGIPYRRGFLFAGPPGCGKTLTLKTLAYNTSATFITILGKADVTDDVVGFAMDLAERHTPAVVLLEDLDRLVQVEGLSLSHLLNLLDGLRALNGVLVIATCNEPDKLDPALIHRASRFDRVWRFDLPKYEQRLELLRKKGGTFFSESALEATARRTEGFSMAYVQEIVVNALLECAHDEIDPTDDHLFKSLDALRMQRKSAAKPGESLEQPEGVGFRNY